MPQSVIVWTIGDIIAAAFFAVFLVIGLMFVIALGVEKAKRALRKTFADFLKGKRE